MKTLEESYRLKYGFAQPNCYLGAEKRNGIFHMMKTKQNGTKQNGHYVLYST